MKAQKYMNVEDTLAVMEGIEKPKGEGKKGVRPKRMKNGTNRLLEY